MSCLVHGLHGVWCFVSGVGRWHTGQHTQRVCHSVSKGRRLRGFCYPPHSHLMCVWTHVCVHKAHFPSSSRSVVSQARLSRGGSESLAYKTTRTAQLFCRKTYRLSSLDPTLAFCLFKDPCWYKRFLTDRNFTVYPDSTISWLRQVHEYLDSTMKLLRGNLTVYTRIPPYHDKALSPWMPGLNHFQAIDRIKMVDDHDVK